MVECWRLAAGGWRLVAGSYRPIMSGLFDTTAVPAAYERYLVDAIFRPWAHVLLDFVQVAAGDAVLDVASGTGIVARTAAELVGDSGRVLATDISPGMLAVAGAADARVGTLVASADDLAGAPGGFDAVVCQQGFQFLPDPVSAAAAMGRGCRDGGRVAVAVWLAGPVLEPFDIYGRALQDCGVLEPFPRAYAYDFTTSVDDVAGILTQAGLRGIEVTTRELELTWPSIDDAVRGIAGTPYGPPAAALPPHEQVRLTQELRDRLRSPFPMTAVLGRARPSRTTTSPKKDAAASDR
jgi:SAM-dependent methyltransferase